MTFGMHSECTLVVRAQPEKVLEDFQGFGGKVLVTSMDDEQVARLRQAWIREHISTSKRIIEAGTG